MQMSSQLPIYRLLLGGGTGGLEPGTIVRWGRGKGRSSYEGIGLV